MPDQQPTTTHRPQLRHLLLTLCVVGLGAAVLVPVGTERVYGRTRTAIVAGPAAGAAAAPDTTPWLLLGVVRQRSSLLEGVRSALIDPPRHFAGDAGEPDGELVDSDSNAHAIAEMTVGRDIDAQVHLGVGSGNSGELLTTLAYIAADGEHDPAGCRRDVGCLSVAATGSMRPDGSVGNVAAVSYKVDAAATSDADVVFVPTLAAYGPAESGERFLDYRDMGSAHRDGELDVVAVRSVADTLAWLCGATGDLPTCATAANHSTG